MKRSIILWMLCLVSIIGYAEFRELNNGWQQHFETTVLSNNPLNGLYFVKVNDSTEFKTYIDISSKGDTICELFIEAKDANGDNKIFYTFDKKSTYFFNVFRDNESQKLSLIRFEYNEENEFTTGFYPNGLGQNNLAKKIAFLLLSGHQLKFVVTPNLAEFQEIKEFTVPSMK